MRTLGELVWLKLWRALWMAAPVMAGLSLYRKYAWGELL